MILYDNYRLDEGLFLLVLIILVFFFNFSLPLSYGYLRYSHLLFKKQLNPYSFLPLASSSSFPSFTDLYLPKIQAKKMTKIVI